MTGTAEKRKIAGNGKPDLFPLILGLRRHGGQGPLSNILLPTYQIPNSREILRNGISDRPSNPALMVLHFF